MRQRLAEGSGLFLNVLKWFVLATIIGILVGASTALFIKVLGGSIAWAGRIQNYYWSLPLALCASVLLTWKLAPDAKGHGTEKVIEAVHKRAGRISPLVVPVKLVATVITLACGGSAGKEGPCAQIGAGLASLFSDIARFNDADRRKLVICGVSAGFAAVFGTPLAGAIFGIEVLFVGSILYDVLLPSFVAGIIGFQVSSALGVTYFREAVRFVPDFSETYFVKVALSGVFFGLCAHILIQTLAWGEALHKRIRLPGLVKALLGGLALVGLASAFSPRYLGLGLDGIQDALAGKPVAWYDFLLKPVFTSLTLGFGGSGGILTPTFFVGATAGSAYAGWMGLNPATFAAIGFVSLLAGAANTPIAASIMAVEVFGPAIGPYAALACVISFLMTGYRSVYPSQILSVQKSSSMQVELGQQMEGLHHKVQFQSTATTRTLTRVRRILERRLRKREEPM